MDQQAPSTETRFPQSVQGFWDFCRERESIRLRKEAGEHPPWTDDPILQKYHFCNIRRQDDYGTRWYLEQVVPAAQDITDLLWRTIFYRSVNNVDWFQHVGGVCGVREFQENKGDIVDRITAAPAPHSPAYHVLQSPDGKPRKDHLWEMLRYLEDNINSLEAEVDGAEELREVWETFKRIPYVGPFISLQIYRDLILVGALRFSDNDFTYLGPGCRKGIQMLLGLKRYTEQYAGLQELQKTDPYELGLTLGDVEHSLCEARKYWVLKGGGGRHRYYKSHRTNVAFDRRPFNVQSTGAT